QTPPQCQCSKTILDPDLPELRAEIMPTGRIGTSASPHLPPFFRRYAEIALAGQLPFRTCPSRPATQYSQQEQQRNLQMTNSINTDILVAGTGPAGLVSALLLAAHDFSVTLAGPPVRLDDARTTALMRPALQVLERIRLDPHFGGEAAPLRVMRIIDATGRLIRSPTANFHAAEIGEDAFGMNIPNRVLNAALAQIVESRPAIRRIEGLVRQWMPSADTVLARIDREAPVEARLVVAAGGRNSPARAAAGIRLHERPLTQSALILSFSHDRPHGNVSTEFHTPHGPFTLVPLPGNRSSLVFVQRPRDAEEMLQLDDE